MTIAAGFLYDRGLLLCADTQYTGFLRLHASKIFPYEYGDGSRSAFIFTGPVRYGRMGAQLIQESLADLKNGEATLAKMQQVLIEGVLNLYRTHLYNHPEWPTGTLKTNYLVGLWSAVDRQLAFYGTEDTAVVRLYGYECFRSGEILGHYLIRPKYRRVTKITQIPNHTEADVKVLAYTALQEVKANDPNCGGETEYITLTATGELSSVKILDPPVHVRHYTCSC